jgi:iron complex transport system substrate-binding protein
MSLICFPSQPLFAGMYIDNLGRSVEIYDTPRRIVSLSPHITEILYAIGLRERIVGVTRFSDYPEEAKEKERIGSYINLDLEKIISLQPDLIISTSDGNPKEDIDKLASLGHSVFVISHNDIDGIYRSILKIGEITGQEAESVQLVSQMEEHIENIRLKLRNTKIRPVFYQLGDNPLITTGKSTFIDSLIELAGGRNIAGDIDILYPRFSMEQVLASAPEVIIISSMAEKKASSEVLKKWEKWKEIPAVRHKEIFFINPDLIHRPGPRIVEGLEKLSAMIHPERF